ncbi:protein-L-isoaspartate O-methyltransferase domain-containing protein 1-like [Leptopilina heterotoma]|uniref:protein-L-isoaspartate O-methyltransferase domain-containing protein 1-like n=1 Tax=Leptopilina heterotoma TaxID=63436 RepID=UPI001CA8E9F4|nr:protein-L-isoaspartate O-methyltransferase domain-containing protein 1-like [Leptopilina heterotoma]XP_043480557.1 protein-L-isoaspartate O-methyltransferase domain-containing protein 1-like [Leptopilina heterotoma]
MGGAVSSGQDNDELVDNLIESGYIRTKAVEKVFRAIDRADYFLSSHRESAYKDFAWKHGNIHLSAPCVYSEVMEGLSLKPGLSFLNLGSGTGYLSTMAGLILTQSGINHGIELHEDCLKYAHDRMDEFKQKSLAIDEFDFCEPRFIKGNCLSLVPGRRYDRVYCGATCPESHEAFIKQLVKVGGILVMPYKDHLLRVERTDENTWINKTMLPVSFATLVVPSSCEQNLIHLPECDPVSLQELCRLRIRRRLRKIVWLEHADLEFKKPILAERRRTQSSSAKTLRRFVIPIFEESDESLPDEDDDYTGRTRLLLNVDAHSGEAITTTLQLVRAVNLVGCQLNRDENQANEEAQTTNTNRTTSHQSSFESVDSTNSSNSTEIQSNHEDKQFPCTETYQISDSSTSSDSVCDKIDDTSNKTMDNGNEKCRRESNLDTYLSMSESDSDQEQDYTIKQRKKIAKREKIDSNDIIDDFRPINNEDTSSSSNTQTFNSDVVETMDYQTYDIFRDNATYPTYRPMNNREQRMGNPLDPSMGHYVDSNAFSSYLKEKIHQLPLPHALKLYLNYNRNL